MIRPESVAFDIDGVVADTMNLFLDIAKKEHGINHIQYEDITRYILSECLDLDETVIWDILIKLLDGSHNDGLKPMPGAVEVLTRLGESHVPLRFVTARPDLKPIQDWMLALLPFDASQVDIVATGSFEAKKRCASGKRGIPFCGRPAGHLFPVERYGNHSGAVQTALEQGGASLH